MFPLLVGAQQYDWGRPSTDSTVFKLLSENHRWVKEIQPVTEVYPVDETRPFAELWIGTHPSLPSFVVRSSLCSLDQVLLEHSSSLHNGTEKLRNTTPLPFLLKVLSIQKSLSVQAHPDLTVAQQLHQNNPTHYPDDNHKPEMAVALSACEVLYGFRKLEEIELTLLKYEEVREACGLEAVEQFLTKIGTSSNEEKRSLLKNLVSSLLEQTQEVISNCIARLLPKMKALSSNSDQKDDVKYANLLLRLYDQHGMDSGVILSLFLNFFTLEPGEALFIAANEPHAYVSGELVEIMACSDNVVRAGLTPKYKDVPTLLKMLSFQESDLSFVKFSGKIVEDGVVCYTPPVEEFELELIHVRSFKKFQARSTCLMLCLSGNGKINCNSPKEGFHNLSLKEGSCICLLEGCECVVENADSHDLFYCLAHIRNRRDAQ
jgi:mannose-6-phosphate isomerase